MEKRLTISQRVGLWLTKGVRQYEQQKGVVYGPFSSEKPQAARRDLVQHNRNWVYICASRNAETVAGCELKLFARGATRSYLNQRQLSRSQKRYLGRIGHKSVDDVTEIEGNHPLLDLLTVVNTEINQSELFEGTTLYQELTGDAYWYLEPGPLGLPMAIWPLMSQYVKIVRNDAGELVGYLYGKDSLNRIALDVTEVIHFRYANPESNDYGLSPLQATMGAANLLQAQEEYLEDSFKNGGIPHVGIMVKSPLPEAEKKRLYSEWYRRFASRIKGDKAIIFEGDMDLKTFGYPPQEAGIEFTQKFMREEICAAFGVPLTMIQLNEASRAGAEAGNYSYMQFTIAPKLRRLAMTLTEQLAALYDEKLFFEFENPVPEDKAARLTEIQTRLNTRMTSVNEEREIEGMPPVAWGNEPIMPVAPQPFGGQSQEPDTPKPNPGEPPPPKEPAKAAIVNVPISFRRMLTDYVTDYATAVDEALENAHAD